MSSVPKLVIEGIQTTPPTSVTNPKTSFKISTSVTKSSPDALTKYSHIILYYKKLGGEESGWFHSGWIKATLGKVLSEQPLLGGRLRKPENSEGAGFEIVSNDSGVRVMDANIPISLEEFLAMNKNEKEVASVLLHLKDVDENIQFSPLIYIQVTNFKCGGYSIGVSYNLLLADPFLMESFLRRWAEIHKTTIFESNIPKMPLFYLPNIKRLGNPPPELIVLKPPTNHISTNAVYLEVNIARSPSHNTCNSIALSCIREAETRTGVKMTPNLTMLVKEASGDVRLDVMSLSSLIKGAGGSRYEAKCLGCDELGVNAAEFWKGNAPTLVSRYVGCVSQEGLVYLVIFPKDDGKLGMKGLVAFPNSSSET